MYLCTYVCSNCVHISCICTYTVYNTCNYHVCNCAYMYIGLGMVSGVLKNSVFETLFLRSVTFN